MNCEIPGGGGGGLGAGVNCKMSGGGGGLVGVQDHVGDHWGTWVIIGTRE